MVYWLMMITHKKASDLTTADAIVDEERGTVFPVKNVEEADSDMLYVDLELPSKAVHTYSFGKVADVAVQPAA